MGDDVERKLNQVAGRITETVGKMTNMEELELEGKLQKLHGRMSEMGSEAGEQIKEKTMEKANDLLDGLDERLDSARNNHKL